MKTAAASFAGVVILSRTPTAVAAGGQPTVVGSRAPSLVSSWTEATSWKGRRRVRSSPNTCHRPPEPLSGSALAATLRGGWLGVDLVQEIAKAYLESPEGAATNKDGDKGGGQTIDAAGGGGERGGQGRGRSGRGRSGRRPTDRRAEGWDSASARATGGTGKDVGGGVAGGSSDSAQSKGCGAVENDSGGRRGSVGGGDGWARSGGGRSGDADGERAADGGAVKGQMGRLRSALQQQAGAHKRDVGGTGPGGSAQDNRGDPSDNNNNNNNNNNRGYRCPRPSVSKQPRFSDSGSFPGDDAPRSATSKTGMRSMAAAPEGGADYAFNDDGGYEDGGDRSGDYNHEAFLGEDEQRWGDRAGLRGSRGGGMDDVSFDHATGGEVYHAEDGGGTDGKGEDEEDEDEELARAKAAAAAERTRNEIALLKEVESLQSDHPGFGRPGETLVVPPLGQHTRSVVTQAMPARFVEEVGATIASALALAFAKGLIHAVMNMRTQKKPEKVAFKDVIGCDEAKQEVKQIVDFLVDPSAYDSLGAARPKGILLVGPPGTGKTLIAKAVAGEAGVPFLYACGSDFNGVYVGMGVAAVKRLFARARKHKKSIIYIDEIDYLGRSRNSGSRDASGATQDREATLNQLLSEMDGFEGKDGIIVMASTNRKEILDDALLRSGRFDMQVDVERPDRKGREQLFSKYIAPLKLSDGHNQEEAAASGGSIKHRSGGGGGVRSGRYRYFGGAAAAAERDREKEAAIKKQGLQDDIAKELADMTPFMTGADVANVCATAGRIAARSGSDAVMLEHFSAAVDRVQHGLEKPDKEVAKEDKERTAIHEAGHAVAAWMLPWCDEVVKTSIVWRGNALGFSQTATVERQSEIREMVLDNVCMTLAGRAAEEVMCGTVSGGASSDLRMASRQLYSAITEVGFGSATGLLAPGNRQLSEKVMAEIDEEVQTLLARQYQRALALVRTHRGKIERLSAALLEHNVVHKADLRRILGDKVTVESEAAAAADALTTALLEGDGENSKIRNDDCGGAAAAVAAAARTEA